MTLQTFKETVALKLHLLTIKLTMQVTHESFQVPPVCQTLLNCNQLAIKYTMKTELFGTLIHHNKTYTINVDYSGM